MQGRRPVRIFLYGTLRRGGGADQLLRGCTPEGPATVRGRLHDLGPYPALVLDPGGDPVHGEIWECPGRMLGELDRYEGVQVELFERVKVRLAGRPCFVYVAGSALQPRLDAANVLTDGRWPVSGDV